MKKLFALLVPLALCVCALAAQTPFEDVPADAYYADAVLWAYEKDVTRGTSETQFSPESTCTRGQVVTFLWRAAGQPEPGSQGNPFSDVSTRSPFYKAILWAVEQGITNGTSPSTFAPGKTCTCANIITFLWRAAGSPESGAPSPITAGWPDAYYNGAVSWADFGGLLEGTGDFVPSDPCTRARTVTWLYRAHQGTAEEPGGEEEVWNPVVMQRQVMLDNGSMCGVALAAKWDPGQVPPEQEHAYWVEQMSARGMMEAFPFLPTLPDANVVESQGGTELYLIMPFDENASVTVNQWICDESNGFVGEPGEVLYKSEVGAPILLKCNVSDAVCDCQVVIVDSQGNTLDWTPHLSLADGTVSNYSEGKLIVDFTNYEPAKG